jgi:hypothetical protein
MLTKQLQMVGVIGTLSAFSRDQGRRIWAFGLDRGLNSLDPICSFMRFNVDF